MKRQIMYLSLVLLVPVLLSNDFPHAIRPGDGRKFKISIQQNGKMKDIKDNVVVLSRDSFDILVEMSEPMGVLVNASFKKETFKLASKNKPLDALPGFRETGIADYQYNKDRDVYLSYLAPNYWYYSADDDNRFNKVEKSEKAIIGTRTIKTLRDADVKTSMKIEDVKKPLYLVFVSYKKGKDILDKIEIQREYVMIKWKK